MAGRTRRVGGLLLAVTLLGACGSTAVPSQPVAIDESAPPATTVPSGLAAPSATDVAPSSSPAPRSTTPAPTATPRPAAWSKPARVTDAECDGFSFTIDRQGGNHIAARCGGKVRVFSSEDAISWQRTSFAAPGNRIEEGAQLAADGETLYLATTRLAPTDGGCGDDGLREVGVFVRTKQLPNGTWSRPVRIGLAGDGLLAFRVTGGVTHAIVTQGGDVLTGGAVFYESLAGSILTRIKLPRAAAGATLRVGDDGHARLAYPNGRRLVYARVDGDQLVKETVASSETTNVLWPALVLGAGDAGYLSWTQDVTFSGGCAEPDYEPPPDIGTYFSTDESGHWVTERISRSTDGAALTLDPASGRVHLLLQGARLKHLTRRNDGTWARESIRTPKGVYAATMRVDPTTGKLVVVMIKDSNGRIYVMTRG